MGTRQGVRREYEVQVQVSEDGLTWSAVCPYCGREAGSFGDGCGHAMGLNHNGTFTFAIYRKDLDGSW